MRRGDWVGGAIERKTQTACLLFLLSGGEDGQCAERELRVGNTETVLGPAVRLAGVLGPSPGPATPKVGTVETPWARGALAEGDEVCSASPTRTYFITKQNTETPVPCLTRASRPSLFARPQPVPHAQTQNPHRACATNAPSLHTHTHTTTHPPALATIAPLRPDIPRPAVAMSALAEADKLLAAFKVSVDERASA